MTKVALFGGIYSNWLALAAAIDDARRRGAQKMYCLGDLGAFGPHPDRVWPLLQDANVECVQGNYDHSIGHRLRDCQCGYTDPRDNQFAQLSYDYTDAHTSEPFRAWMRELPCEIRFELDGHHVLLCHGSPRRTNEFLWESTTSTAFLERLATEYDADVICGTHTGLHWQREFSMGRRFVNVGVLGRPANDGTTRVWYAMLSTTPVPSPPSEWGRGDRNRHRFYPHRLRPRTPRRGNACGALAAGVHRHHSDRLVDDVPGSAAGERTSPRAVLNWLRAKGRGTDDVSSSVS